MLLDAVAIFSSLLSRIQNLKSDDASNYLMEEEGLAYLWKRHMDMGERVCVGFALVLYFRVWYILGLFGLSSPKLGEVCSVIFIYFLILF